MHVEAMEENEKIKKSFGYKSRLYWRKPRKKLKVKRNIKALGWRKLKGQMLDLKGVKKKMDLFKKASFAKS